jgi:hypothetical protein
LSEEQKVLKSQRKTGTLPELPRNDWGWIEYEKVPANIKEAWKAANKVQSNKPRITAALNLYHELRGSDYRHGIPEDPYFYGIYKKALREFREQFTALK